MLGGRWTREHVGRNYDYFMGIAAKSASRDFCNKYPLSLSMRCSIAKFGEQIASALCRAWMHKMQYLFGVYPAAQDLDYTFTDEDTAMSEEPPEPFAVRPQLNGPERARADHIRSLRPRGIVGQSIGASFTRHGIAHDLGCFPLSSQCT